MSQNPKPPLLPFKIDTLLSGVATVVGCHLLILLGYTLLFNRFLPQYVSEPWQLPLIILSSWLIGLMTLQLVYVVPLALWAARQRYARFLSGVGWTFGITMLLGLVTLCLSAFLFLQSGYVQENYHYLIQSKYFSWLKQFS